MQGITSCPLIASQERIPPFSSLATMRFPSALKLKLLTSSLSPLSVRTAWPLCVPHHHRRVPAADDAFAVGAERHADNPARVSLERQDFLARVGIPQLELPAVARVADRPLLPLTTRLPSALNATLATLLVCPLRVRIAWPLSASHTLTVLSSLPLTMCLPSALNATLVTGRCVP